MGFFSGRRYAEEAAAKRESSQDSRSGRDESAPGPAEGVRRARRIPSQHTPASDEAHAPVAQPETEIAPLGAPTAPAEGATEGRSAVASIGKSVVFKGDLSGDEDLLVEGRVEGGIQLGNHELTIGENGRAQAELYAKSIVVLGTVIGNVTATERLEIRASGSIEGDIHTPRLSVEEGAALNGRIEMSEVTDVARVSAAALPPTPESEGETAAPSHDE